MMQSDRRRSRSTGRTVETTFDVVCSFWKKTPKRSVWLLPELLAGVGLHAGREARQPRGVGEAVEDDVALVGIGRELRLRVADERRDLEVQRVAGILIGGDAIMGDFALVLVELGGVEAVDAIDGEVAC